MSAISLQARVNTRSVKKLEKPRPLKLNTSQSRHAENRLSMGGVSVDEVMALADTVCQHILNGNCDRALQSNVVTLSSSLKLYGQQLETIYKDQLDRLFVTFRNGSRDEKLDYISRVHLLELVELRGSNWSGCDNMSDYYRHKIAHTHNYEVDVIESPVTPSSALASLGQFGQANPLASLNLTPAQSPTTPQPTLLNPGEILKTSGKYPKPTKIPNKNYCKDEVVIRNSDSGKVMGIKGRRVHMIEEMSETIISFQRVNPGAKERLVQITGPTEEKIVHARQLMEDTIRRNASPVRPEQPDGIREHHETLGGSSSSLNSSASEDSVRISQGGARRSTLLHSFSTNDASLGEYKYTVAVGSCVLKITCSNHDIVRAAKLVLDEYFAGQDLGYFDGYEEELPSPSNTSAPVPNSSSSSPTTSMPLTSVETAVPVPLSEIQSPSATTDPAPVSLIETGSSISSTENSVAAIPQSDSVDDEAVAPTNLPAGESIKRKQYTYEELLSLATSPISHDAPPDWARIARDFPSILKKMEPFEAASQFLD
ncbi:eukaryotic translation initiation factor 4E-binding protein Mextli isoform X3 [Thrips palmi]|nr:eukaryotic translation initiation factor 4E-binding protein Mextli isoform X3 [Thrips palmi]XP_034233993.1 eukaryotic translation initiation factor 4E-binding protein Mextli isoform X3 [Thrips palmi]XP_034233994.1 eukaryotic translation initiation factor 4E-binding protein Mextli isoform X3 [Thrips palmi]